jgi:hypothetical protein
MASLMQQGFESAIAPKWQPTSFSRTFSCVSVTNRGKRIRSFLWLRRQIYCDSLRRRLRSAL